MSDRRGATQLLVAGLLGLSLLVGCAGTSTQPDLRPVPADAPPELDFLLGRQAEAEGDLEAAIDAYSRALSKDPESVYLLKQLAELSARENRLTDALVYAERAYDLAPEEEGIRLFLGTLYRLRKDAVNAERVLLDPDGAPFTSDAALLLYGVYSDSRQTDDARQMAEWLTTNEPDGLRGWFALADAYDRLGDPAASERALRDGLERHPGELALYGALARSRREHGDRVGEIEIYREMLVLEPEHHGTLLALADAQLALHRTDAALDTLARIEDLYPDDVRTSLRVAFLEFERGNLEEARDRFASALAANPDAHEVAYFLGVTLRRLEDEEAAIDAFEGIPAGHGRFAEARTQIASIREEQGDLAAAIADVERARAVAASRPLDLYLASLRAKAGDVQGALDFLESLVEASPDDAELLYNLGVIHGEAKNVEEAIRYMRIVLVKDPDHAGALNYVGYTFAEQGTNLDEAETLISRALELRPDDGYITDSLGWVYYMRARPLVDAGRDAEARALLDRAIEELERADELTGGDPVISEHLGDVYLLLGDKERALGFYEEAFTQDPRFDEQPELEKKLEMLRQELGTQ